MIIHFLRRIMSDFYRVYVVACDWHAVVRKLRQQPQWDVAFISNQENSEQKDFIGLRQTRDFVTSLRFRVGEVNAVTVLINSDAQSLQYVRTRVQARAQFLKAIDFVAAKGVKVVLFAAGTKRLLTKDDMSALHQKHPDLLFTIGDNGTAIALLDDIYKTIKQRKLDKQANILILGPNGFLGTIVRKQLIADGYKSLYFSSFRDRKPFAEKQNIDMVIACSHHERLILNAENLGRIASKQGIAVIDVCRPANLTELEYQKCQQAGLDIYRQDSGMFHIPRIHYFAGICAHYILKTVKLERHTLYGCFSEATALAAQTTAQAEISQKNLLQVNTESMRLIYQYLISTGFMFSNICNFGEPIVEIP